MRRRTFVRGLAAGLASGLLASEARADGSIVLFLHGGEAGAEALARGIKEGIDAGSRMVLRVTASSPLRDTLSDRNVVLVYTVGEVALRLVVESGGSTPLVHLGVDEASVAAGLDARWAVYAWPDPAESLAGLLKIHPRMRRIHLPRAEGDDRVWWEALRLAGHAQAVDLAFVPCASPAELEAMVARAEVVWVPPDPRFTTEAIWARNSAIARTQRVVLVGGSPAQAASGELGVAIDTDIDTTASRAAALGMAIIGAEPVRKVSFVAPRFHTNGATLRRAGVFTPRGEGPPDPS